MADMDTVIIRDRDGEFISATLGPRGHELSRFELLRMIANAIKDAKEAGPAPWNEDIVQRDVKDWLEELDKNKNKSV